MKYKAIQVGEIGTNCYLVYDEKTMDCAVVDPGDDADVINGEIKRCGLSVRAILLTHGHFDHTSGLDGVYAKNPAPVYISKCDIHFDDQFAMGKVRLRDGYVDVKDGDLITAGSLSFTALSTPGHTPGSLTFLCGGLMLSGDTLFRGSCGRTDFPGGSWKDISASLVRLYKLEGDYQVLPGHMEPSTLSRERKTNPFMQEAVTDAML